jgi:hypothetical protein
MIILGLFIHVIDLNTSLEGTSRVALRWADGTVVDPEVRAGVRVPEEDGDGRLLERRILMLVSLTAVVLI